MPTNKNQNQELSFEYKLVDVQKTGYFENDIEECSFKDEVKKGNVPFHLTASFIINSNDSIVDVKLNVKFIYEEHEKEHDLFGIDTSHKFRIKNFNEIFPQDDKKEIFVPDEVIASFLGVAISGTRGMLKIMTTNKIYTNVLLPLIHPMKVLNQDNTKAKS